MSELTIRKAHLSELPAIGALTVAAYRADGTVSDSYALRLADAAARSAEADLLAAVDEEDTLLGTVTVVRPGTPWSEISVAGQLEFRMLAVAPAARGRGVGEALVRHVLDQAAEEGLEAVVLSSSQTMAAAHRLYERMGFRRTPESDWSPTPGFQLITYRQNL